ncbi:flippase [Pleomorphovibrio marinus]|uniref:flippase n=1 Tax=Pleomorphovibrio marinus TaxID=2164132 RepID=UPI000E0C37AE|nr:flippase [Pleomorphovibrio marinus]
MRKLKKDKSFVGAIGNIFLKFSNIGFRFMTTIVLAQVLGVIDFGTYSFFQSLIVLITLPAVLGFEHLLVREIAQNKSKNRYDLLKGILIRSNQIVFLSSVIVSILFLVFIYILNPIEKHPSYNEVVFIIVPIIVLLSLTKVRQAALQGLNEIVKGNLSERFIRPFIFLLLITIVWVSTGDLTLKSSFIFYLISTLIAFLFGLYLLLNNIPRIVKETTPTFKTRDWMREALPLVLVSGMRIVHDQIDIVIVGSLLGAEATSFYNISYKGAELTMFMLIPITAAYAPKMASLYIKNEMIKLQKTVKSNSYYIFICTLPIALALIVFNENFLSIFGEDFIEAKNILIILVIAQLINACCGPSSQLLIYCNKTSMAANSLTVSVIINISLNFILIPFMGLNGAAVSTFISILIWNILTVYYCIKYIKINPTIIHFKSLV